MVVAQAHPRGTMRDEPGRPMPRRCAPARSSTRGGSARSSAEHVPGARAPLRVRQFPGGHSNLTYLCAPAATRVVLRRPPFGSRLKSAHDMGREFRGAVAPARRLLRMRRGRCISAPTNPVLGAPFYLMERLRGVILRRDFRAGLASTPALVRARSCALDRRARELHAVDYAAPASATRQARRLRRAPGERLDRALCEAADRRLPGGRTSVADWLAASTPPDRPGGADPQRLQVRQPRVRSRRPERLIGVLDWEMATIGDPLMDLGTALGYWVEAGDPELLAIRCCRRTCPGTLTPRGSRLRATRSAQRTALGDILFY